MSTPTLSNVPIQGYCHPRFADVRQVFEQNFHRRGERGAAFCVVHRGEIVVDLWGGWRDGARTQRWETDTAVTIQSTGKGLVSVLFAWLVDQGHLAWHDRVATYWPEFATAGKVGITVEQLISHQAGLCVVDSPLPPGATLDWPRIIAALERQTPAWRPGSDFGYHAVTWSFLLGELAARVSGEPLPALFRRVIATPANLDIGFGVGPAWRERLAEFLPGPPGRSPWDNHRQTEYRERAFRICPPPPGVDLNSDTVRSAPGTVFATARAIARLYAGLVWPGRTDIPQLLSEDAMRDLDHVVVEGEDAVLGQTRRFGRGFWLHPAVRRPVRGPRTFGHPGLGGSFGLADPDRGLAMAYVMNQAGAFLRATHLELAVYRSLEAQA